MSNEFYTSAEVAREICGFVAKIHPVSEQLLANFISGTINEAAFLKNFSLPNSEYVSYAACFINVLNNGIPAIS